MSYAEQATINALRNDVLEISKRCAKLEDLVKRLEKCRCNTSCKRCELVDSCDFMAEYDELGIEV